METQDSKSVILLVIKCMVISICLVISSNSLTTYKLFPRKALIFVLPCSIFRSLAKEINKKIASEAQHSTYEIDKKGPYCGIVNVTDPDFPTTTKVKNYFYGI